MNLLKKSVRVLKSLQLKNGGILSTPIKGAYPYVYTRDAVIMTLALNRTANTKSSEKFYYFMKKFAKIDSYKEVFQRYNYNGWPAVTRKNEDDNEGLLLHGIYDTYLHNQQEVFLQNMWPTVMKVVGLIFRYSKSGLVKTERSIHEFFRLENGYEIWVNCACLRGLKDAVEIAKILNHPKESADWNEKAVILERNIKKRMFNKNLGVFVKNLRYPKVPDMSQLAPFYFNLINDKKILKRTMDYLHKHIWDKEIGGFRRFRKFEICEDWHWYSGGSGSWVALTAWGARFYRKLGNRKMYRECLNWIEEIAKKSRGLLPEHIATKEEYEEWKSHEIEFNNRIINEAKMAEKSVRKFKNRNMVYWATPLGWSHAEYILLNKK